MTDLVLCDLPEPPASAKVPSWSPFCLKVHRALTLAELPYAVRRGRAPADFAHLNPRRQVPVLLVDGEPVVDSTRILGVVAALAPAAGLVPRDPRVRAEAWLWEEWADRALGTHVVAARWLDEPNWEALRDTFFGKAPWFVKHFVSPRIRAKVLAGLREHDVSQACVTLYHDELRRLLDLLETRAPLDGFWLQTERATVADVAISAMLDSLRAGLTPWQAREITLRPALTDYLDRLADPMCHAVSQRAAA
jgi:glutathione S-transferase